MKSGSPLLNALNYLFSLPNWENRGDQSDVRNALKEVHRCFVDPDLHYAKADFTPVKWIEGLHISSDFNDY